MRVQLIDHGAAGKLTAGTLRAVHSTRTVSTKGAGNELVVLHGKITLAPMVDSESGPNGSLESFQLDLEPEKLISGE